MQPAVEGNDMMTKKVLGMMAAASLTAMSLGCGTETVEDDDGSVTKVAPEFPEEQGQTPWAGEDPAYPAGPYGIRDDQIIPNYEFFGYYDYENLGAQVVPIALGDFYNPTGTEVFPEGHPYAGRDKPKVIVMVVSASWCGPCQAEALNDIPEKRDEYEDDVMFLSTLLQGPSGDPATFLDLENWTKAYPVDYPMAVDPADQIFSLYPRAAFPANMMIRTDTMQIVQSVNAAPPSSFWLQAEAIIAGNG